MKRIVGTLLLVALAAQLVAPAVCSAASKDSKDFNPFAEVVKDMAWGALGGLILGGAIALVNNDSNSSDEILRWSVAGGTFAGLGYGLYRLSKAPPPSSMLEWRGGSLAMNPPALAPAPGRGFAVRIVGATF